MATDTSGTGPKCKAASLTPYGEQLNAFAAGSLPSLLGATPADGKSPGTISRVALEKAIALPLRAGDLPRLKISLPIRLTHDISVTDWTRRLVAACDHVYQQQGPHAFIEALTDLIFDEGSDEAGLPRSVRDCCAMLVKNALEAGIAHGLDRTALQGLRNTVIIRFLMGSVFVPHLRPSAMREAANDAGLYAFDRQLFKRFCDKTAEILDIDAEAMVLLALSQRPAQPTDHA